MTLCHLQRNQTGRFSLSAHLHGLVRVLKIFKDKTWDQFFGAVFCSAESVCYCQGQVCAWISLPMSRSITAVENQPGSSRLKNTDFKNDRNVIESREPETAGPQWISLPGGDKGRKRHVALVTDCVASCIFRCAMGSLPAAVTQGEGSSHLSPSTPLRLHRNTGTQKQLLMLWKHWKPLYFTDYMW